MTRQGPPGPSQQGGCPARPGLTAAGTAGRILPAPSSGADGNDRNQGTRTLPERIPRPSSPSAPAPRRSQPAKAGPRARSFSGASARNTAGLRSTVSARPAAMRQRQHRPRQALEGRLRQRGRGDRARGEVGILLVDDLKWALPTGPLSLSRVRDAHPVEGRAVSDPVPMRRVPAARPARRPARRRARRTSSPAAWHRR